MPIKSQCHSWISTLGNSITSSLDRCWLSKRFRSPWNYKIFLVLPIIKTRSILKMKKIVYILITEFSNNMRYKICTLNPRISSSKLDLYLNWRIYNRNRQWYLFLFGSRMRQSNEFGVHTLMLGQLLSFWALPELQPFKPLNSHLFNLLNFLSLWSLILL